MNSVESEKSDNVYVALIESCLNHDVLRVGFFLGGGLVVFPPFE